MAHVNGPHKECPGRAEWFQALQVRPQVPQEPSSASEGNVFFLDMLHLLMLLAKRTEANMDVVKIWIHEVKDFLMGMEKEV